MEWWGLLYTISGGVRFIDGMYSSLLYDWRGLE